MERRRKKPPSSSQPVDAPPLLGSSGVEEGEEGSWLGIGRGMGHPAPPLHPLRFASALPSTGSSGDASPGALPTHSGADSDPGEALCAEEAEPVWEASLEPATSFQVVLKPLFGSTEDEASAFDLAVPQHEAGSPSAFFEQPPPQAQAWEQPTAAAEPARQVQEQAQAWEVQTVAQECAQQAAQAAPWDQAQQAAQGAEQQSGHAAGQHQPASLGSGLEPAAEPWAQQTAAAPWEQQQEQAAPWDEPKSFAAELLVPGPWQPAAAAGLALGQQAADSFFDDLSAETPPATPGPDVPVAGLSAGWQAEGAGCSWDAGDGSLTDAAPAATLWGQAAAMPFERTASDAAWPADAVAYMAAAAAAQPGGPASSTWGNAAEAGGADAFLHEQEAMPACDLQDICSPTAADEAAAEGFGFAGAAPEVQQDLAAGGAFFAGTAGKQPAATAAAGASGGQQTEPTTWCDDAGYCWCDAADGWRYWWDAGSQQWQQHSRTPAAAGSEGGAAASEQQQRQVPEPAVEQQQSELQQQQQHQPQPEQPDAAALPAASSGMGDVAAQPGFASYGSAAGFASYAPGHPGAGAAGQVAYGGGGGPSAGGYPLHSRPPSPFCKLLFGGRLLMVAPSGQLQLHPVARTPAQVLQPLPGAPTCSLAAHLAMLESFPGPLTSSTKQDKVAKFCAEQATDAAAEADDISAAGERRTLWSVLRVLALHQGRISSAPYSLLGGSSPGSGKQPDPASLPEVQLAAALLEGLGFRV
ncbi:hypothetical protein C2E20_8968 [Micractinium conductrix]|uniref:Sec16 central conserved domain-containing protein n=1 Tax=Micractinium conductrix TaxID=554055 RepID=A0A2P6UZT0_9CHLO|nr:hypothetical protein C2E20_8968 [Micractinium conductrix]|eukprot:PSC67333.1 hypothetical protein C2E20_8968 [Micractinium conductrix]